jgi:hypothetical protein
MSGFCALQAQHIQMNMYLMLLLAHSQVVWLTEASDEVGYELISRYLELLHACERTRDKKIYFREFR